MPLSPLPATAIYGSGAQRRWYLRGRRPGASGERPGYPNPFKIVTFYKESDAFPSPGRPGSGRGTQTLSKSLLFIKRTMLFRARGVRGAAGGAKPLETCISMYLLYFPAISHFISHVSRGPGITDESQVGHLRCESGVCCVVVWWPGGATLLRRQEKLYIKTPDRPPQRLLCYILYSTE